MESIRSRRTAPETGRPGRRRRMLTVLLAAAVCAGASLTTIAPAGSASADDAATPSARPPDSRREEIVDVIHGTPVEDPYRWLERAEDPEVQDWMRAQDDYSRSHLAQLPAGAALRKRLRQLHYTDAISTPTELGGRLFYARTPADSEKQVVYVKEGAAGPERVLIDANTLSADGSVALHGWWPSRDGHHLAYTLSQNNADAATLHLRRVDTGEDLPGEVIDRADHAQPAWTPDGKSFYYTWLPSDPALSREDREAKAEIRLHGLGTDTASDPVVHPALDDPTVTMDPSLSWDGRWLFLTVYRFSRTDLWFKDLQAAPTPVPPGAGPSEQAGFRPLAVGRDALFYVDAWEDRFFVLTSEEAPQFRLFRVDPGHPERDAWEEVVPEAPDATLENFNIVGGRLALSYLRKAVSNLEVRTFEGQRLYAVDLPGLGTASGVRGNPESDAAWFTFESFTDRSQVFRLSVASGRTGRWELDTRPVAGTDQAVTEQIWYPSKGGTPVSMFLVHRTDLARDGNRPVLLTGYGGFGISLTPTFSPPAVAWVEGGGVYALPNLRGGGEYGEAWHRAGMREHKQNVFDDFLAAASYLIAEGFTRPERIAIQGGSNGGLLVGAAMTQRPDLFGAVVCQVPLLDMIRYHRFGAGQFWVDEYGSAENPDEFKVLHAYSPYHRVVKDTAYPALLMMSADADDRVDPLHARKFVAAVQWASNSDRPAWLRIERNAGHGGGDSRAQRVEAQADALAFMLDQLGVDAPDGSGR